MCQSGTSYIGQGLVRQPGPLVLAKGPPVLARGPPMSTGGLLCPPETSFIGQMNFYVNRRASCVGQKAFLPEDLLHLSWGLLSRREGLPYRSYFLLYRSSGLLCREEGLPYLSDGLLVGMRASCVSQVSFPIGRSVAPNFPYRSRTRVYIIHRHFRANGSNATPCSQQGGSLPTLPLWERRH